MLYIAQCVMQATLLLAAAMGKIYLDGDGSAIEFGTASNMARLTATCEAKPEDAPLVSRMAPSSFAGFAPHLSGESQVKLRLKNVALSCGDTINGVPCALPFDEMDLPGWYCTWNNSQHSVVVGPLHAGVSGSTSNASEALTDSTKVKPTLICPLPQTVGPFAGSAGSFALYLYVSYFAPLGSADAVHIPFVGIDNSVQVEFTPSAPPSPPMPPPSTPPPPPIPPAHPPPLPMGRSWYKTATVDYDMRFIPVRFGPPAVLYKYSEFKAVCVGAGMRVWHDEDGSDGDGVLRRDSRSYATSLSGDDVMSNLKTVVTATMAMTRAMRETRKSPARRRSPTFRLWACRRAGTSACA